MKRLILLLLIVNICNSLFAQKDFEGIITYKLTPPETDDEEKRDQTLYATVYFAPGKILFSVKESTEPAENEVLFRLDSGLFYFINKEQKTYRIKTFPAVKSISHSGPEKILGHGTTPVEIFNWGMETSNAVLYLADDLYYHFPAAYKHHSMLMVVYNDRIILKGSINMQPPFASFEYGEERKDMIIQLEATSIEPKTLPPSLFEIPADYKIASNAWMGTDSIVALDTMAYPVPDTIPSPPPVKKTVAPKKPAPAKPATKNTPAKSPARKEN